MMKQRRLLPTGIKRLARSVCPTPALLWLETRYLERHGERELGTVRHLCAPNRDAIDVGANVGSYLHFMCRYARRVHAFEPIPWLAERIKQTFGSRVTTHCLALSRTSGIARLRIPVVRGEAVTGLSSLADTPMARYDEHRPLDVPTAPLDAVYRGDAGFMKIDVEGHEEAVLDGAQEMLSRCRPRLLIEIEERHAPGAIARVSQHLARLDYAGFFILGPDLLPISRFDAGTMQRLEDVLDITEMSPARYVNNFLFLPLEGCQQTVASITRDLARHRI
jgi:FkbM family methyltransferase